MIKLTSFESPRPPNAFAKAAHTVDDLVVRGLRHSAEPEGAAYLEHLNTLSRDVA